MDFLETARLLVRSGRFEEAIRALDGGSVPSNQKTDRQVLRCEILERLGRHLQARSLATGLLKTLLSSSQHATCEYVIGKVCLEDGDTDQALSHLQKAASLASEVGDLQRLCWAQIALLLVIADRFGAEPALPLLAEARATATRSGDSQLMAALHVSAAKMDGRRGSIGNAARHARFAKALLVAAPNVWLEAAAENTDFAASITRSEFDVAHSRGRRAIDLAQSSGIASTLGGSLCNLGNLHQALGDLDLAVSCFERALSLLPPRGENALVSLQSLARVRLAQDRWDECGQILQRIDETVQSDDDMAKYAHRHAALTRAQLFMRRCDFVEAHAQTARVVSLSERVGDGILYSMGVITEAELFLEEQRIDDCLSTLGHVASHLLPDAPELYARYECVLARAAETMGDSRSAEAHYNRATRLCKSVRHQLGVIEIERARMSTSGRAAGGLRPEEAGGEGGAFRAMNAIQGVAAIIMLGARHEFVAREVVDLLRTANCVDYAGASAYSSEDGRTEALCEWGTPATSAPQATLGPACIEIGVIRDRSIRVGYRLRDDAQSLATLNAVELLISALRELERARQEREEHSALWPVQEAASPGAHAVASGHMREVLVLDPIPWTV